MSGSAGLLSLRADERAPNVKSLERDDERTRVDEFGPAVVRMAA